MNKILYITLLAIMIFILTMDSGRSENRVNGLIKYRGENYLNNLVKTRLRFKLDNDWRAWYYGNN